MLEPLQNNSIHSSWSTVCFSFLPKLWLTPLSLSVSHAHIHTHTLSPSLSPSLISSSFVPFFPCCTACGSHRSNSQFLLCCFNFFLENTEYKKKESTILQLSCFVLCGIHISVQSTHSLSLTHINTHTHTLIFIYTHTYTL